MLPRRKHGNTHVHVQLDDDRVIGWKQFPIAGKQRF
jgi:hypothetical protein